MNKPETLVIVAMLKGSHPGQFCGGVACVGGEDICHKMEAARLIIEICNGSPEAMTTTAEVCCGSQRK